MLRRVHAIGSDNCQNQQISNEMPEPLNLMLHWAVSDIIPYGHSPSYTFHRQISINFV